MNRIFYIGLIGAAVLGVVDILGVFAVEGEFPPREVVIAGAVLGLITVVAVVLAWRGSRAATGVVIGTRALSAVGAVPAFIVDDVPGWAVGLAAGLIAVTVVVIACLLSGLRRSATPQ